MLFKNTFLYQCNKAQNSGPPPPRRFCPNSMEFWLKPKLPSLNINYGLELFSWGSFRKGDLLKQPKTDYIIRLKTLSDLKHYGLHDLIQKVKLNRLGLNKLILLCDDKEEEKWSAWRVRQQVQLLVGQL